MPNLDPETEDDGMDYTQAPFGAARGFAERLAEQAFVLTGQAGSVSKASVPDGGESDPDFSIELGQAEDVLKIARRAAEASATRGDAIDDLLAQIRTLQAQIAA
jgi:hypothetical protein